ncbi:hypothetical protein IQ224_13455 [Microcystis sp. LEGE 00066]|jgi:hypothetical protein|uniref:Uncharacterized protein n=3 Tax=Microcystis TaxID=1125 RepID=A0A3E0KWR5_9CHRO|nr:MULTISPECIES: hypothetical protein [Microcystis]REJ39720.1 MAG: hypothetical protein DWQ54_20480 [Microcystis flos-aquae TF09]TRT95457.1 MAG: hypothetical protein EWV61_22345 [Microcystis aeruginosa Ma_AC_P_19900807_S300]ARI80001.1 hypothetical protein BH695_0720 [Microcystis aeruginosa PCC 7806SL]ELS47059.1 hypothetical protein C789_3152 [Microcystis aeruginosa FACHB-905 = DIANCHI905]MBE9263136.1 hypothetical protein [Microcystis sp. LEGE 00066]
MSDKLIESFNYERQDTLKKKLTEVNSLQEVADIIQNELAFYGDIGGDYINSLTPSQAKTALALLAILRESHDTLGDSVRFKTYHPHEKPSSQHSSELVAIQNTVVITIGAGMGAGMGFLGGPLGVICGAAIGSGIAKFVSDSFQEKSPSAKNKQQRNQVKLELDIDKLISELVNLLKKIDKLVLQEEPVSQPKPEEKKSQLTDFPEIIAFIQKLAGQRYSGLSKDLDFAMQEELPSLLEVYSLQIDEFSLEDFNLEKLNPEIYRMYDLKTSDKFVKPFIEAPAILKEGQLFLRGKMYLPNVANQ